jgi:hypothetical protein
MGICKFFRRRLSALLVCLLAVPLMAEERWQPGKNTLVVGCGVGIPSGDLRAYMSSSAAFRIKYGYRMTRYLQAEIGLDGVIRGAGISVSQQTFVGEVRKRDFEYMIPFGGRAILPLAAGRLELFAGGGGAYLKYSEEAQMANMPWCYGPSCYIEIPCPACASRSGWGYYGTAGVNVALERRKRVWLGVEAEYIKGATSGKLLSTGAPFETKDRWFNPSLNLVFRF